MIIGRDIEMILNKLAEPGKCPSCKVKLENECREVEGCTPRPICLRYNQHLVLPLLLLPVILLLLGIVRLVARPDNDSLLFKNSEVFNEKHGLEEFEDRDLINGLKTSFVPLFTNTLPLNMLPLSPQTHMRRLRRELKETVLGLQDMGNVSSVDAIVWAAVKPPFKNNRRKLDNPEQKEEEERKNNEYEKGALQDDEQKAAEIKTTNLLIQKKKSNGKSFWSGNIDQRSIRKAQAQVMLSLMNNNVDPCVDFYEYACGGWSDAHPIPKNRAGSGTIEILKSNIDEIVRQLLENDLDIYDRNKHVDNEMSVKNAFVPVLENPSVGKKEMNFSLKISADDILQIVSSSTDMEIKHSESYPTEFASEQSVFLEKLDRNVTRDSNVNISENNEAKSSEEFKRIQNGDILLSVLNHTIGGSNHTLQEYESSKFQEIERKTKSPNVIETVDILLKLKPGDNGGGESSKTPLMHISVLSEQKSNKDTIIRNNLQEEERKIATKVVTTEYTDSLTERMQFPEINLESATSVKQTNSHLHGSGFQSKGDEKNNGDRDIETTISKEEPVDLSNYGGIKTISSQDSLGISVNDKNGRSTVFKPISRSFHDVQQGENRNKFNDSKSTDFNGLNRLKLMKDGSNLETTVPVSVSVKEIEESEMFGVLHKQQRPQGATKKARDFYKSCMNVGINIPEIIEKRAERPLVKLLEELGGGWPKQATMDDVSSEWTILAAKLRLYNNNILIAEWVGPDIHNSDEYVVQLDEAGLGLPSRDYFLSTSNTESVDAYRQFIMTVAKLLGASPKDAEKLADQLVNFEIHLALITASHEEKKNLSELNKWMTVSELSEAVPGINWRQYLGIVLNSTNPKFNISSLNSTPVLVFSLRYFQDLANLLEKYPPRVIQSYMLWRFASHRAGNLDMRFWTARSQLRKALTGREEAPPRWESCVAHTTAALGHAVGSLFVKQHFDEQSKSDMTTEIQAAFRKSILDPNGATASWMDVETRSLAVEKADAMALRVGYPDSILDSNSLDLRYTYLKVDPELYFENTISVLEYVTHREHSLLGTPVDKTQWRASPTEVNAFYSRSKNQIFLPAGILQPPFYHRYFPRSLNYGGVGVVIGHEMTHGFDDRGRLFDRHGNFQTWWQPTAIEAFQERAKCLIDQYKQYYVEEVSMQIDGIRTQSENIADNGGLKQAYKAYEDWLQRNGEGNSDEVEETLPDMNASPRQLFFLNFAQVWCGALRPEAIRNKLKTSVHSLEKFRVIGTLSNSEEFAEAFLCPVGSPMNPEVKCSVW